MNMTAAHLGVDVCALQRLPALGQRQLQHLTHSSLAASSRAKQHDPRADGQQLVQLDRSQQELLRRLRCGRKSIHQSVMTFLFVEVVASCPCQS